MKRSRSGETWESWPEALLRNEQTFVFQTSLQMQENYVTVLFNSSKLVATLTEIQQGIVRCSRGASEQTDYESSPKAWRYPQSVEDTLRNFCFIWMVAEWCHHCRFFEVVFVKYLILIWKEWNYIFTQLSKI